MMMITLKCDSFLCFVFEFFFCFFCWILSFCYLFLGQDERWHQAGLNQREGLLAIDIEIGIHYDLPLRFTGRSHYAMPVGLGNLFEAEKNCARERNFCHIGRFTFFNFTFGQAGGIEEIIPPLIKMLR